MTGPEELADRLAERATLAIGPPGDFAIEGRAAAAAVLRELSEYIAADGRAVYGYWLDRLIEILEGGTL